MIAEVAPGREAAARAGTRFVVDSARKLVHDLAREKPYCGVEPAMKAGSLSVYRRRLAAAPAAGFGFDDACIGERATSTFDGARTILLIMNAPTRDAGIIHDLNERLDFQTRLLIGFERNRDRVKMHERLAKLAIPNIFYQARRKPTG